MDCTKNQLIKPVNEVDGNDHLLASFLKKNAEISVEARQKGNNLYTQKDHNESFHKSILWHFSKSIAFAPAHSEELAHGYSNRSIILIHIHRIQEALVDIERALKFTKSNELKSRLEARKTKCLSLVESQSINQQNAQESLNVKGRKRKSPPKLKKDELPKLPEMTSSETLPCASEAVALIFNEKFGRHFVATRDIEPGEVIIAEDSYVCFPRNNQRYIICSHCLQYSWNGIPCDNCPIAMYCSESCKEKAWKSYHDFECSIFPYLPFMHVDDNNYMPDVIVAVRLFIQAVKKEGLDSILSEADAIDRAKETNLTLFFNEVLEHGKFRSFYNLSSSVQNTEDKDKIIDALLAKIILFLSNFTSIFDETKNSDNSVDKDFYEKIKRIMHNISHVIDVNSFEYQGSPCICQDLHAECSCGSNRGVAIAPFSSFVNHSCAPNITRLFLPKKRIVMFTTAPVKKGDQLYDSYGPSLRMEKSTRQKLLLENFHFTCQCKVCTENWPTLQQLELVVDPASERDIISKVVTEFKKYYPKDPGKFMFQEAEDVWPFNEETLRKTVKMCELIYKYSNNNIKAFLLSSYYRYYIDRVFFKLFGEQCRIVTNCFEL